MLSLGRTLYLWRRERGLSQEALARLAGVSRPNLCVIEREGRDITLATLKRIARALQIRPGLLADGIPPRETSRKRWTRENLDRMARWLAGESFPLSGKERKFALLARSLMKRKLGLTGRYGRRLPRTAREERKDWLMAKAEFGISELENLLSRVQKISGLQS